MTDIVATLDVIIYSAPDKFEPKIIEWCGLSLMLDLQFGCIFSSFLFLQKALVDLWPLFLPIVLH